MMDALLRNETVVVTAADILTGFNTARAIYRYVGRVVGVASHADSACLRSSIWSEILVAGPEVEDAIAILENFGVQQRADGASRPVLLLCQDALVTAIVERSEHFRRLYRFVLPDLDVVRLLMDKTAFNEWAIAQDFLVPHAAIVSNPSELKEAVSATPLPAIIKPIVRTPEWDRRFPNRKFFRIHHAGDVPPDLTMLFGLSMRYLVQQWVPGDDTDVLFCLVYVGADGEVKGSFAGRKLLQWPVLTGSTAICCGAPDEALERLTLNVLTSAGLKGLGSLEVKRSTKDGRYYITEPTVGRNDYQSYVAVAGGVNLSLMAVRDALGVPLGSKPAARPAVWLDEIGTLRAVRGAHTSLRTVIRLIRRNGGLFRARGGLASLRDPLPLLTRVWQQFALVPFAASRRNAISGAHAPISEARARAHSGHDSISVCTVDPDEAEKLRGEWTRLVELSGCDPLFMSWEWQTAWWRTYSDAFGLSPFFLSARTPGGTLIGLAPLFKIDSSLRGIQVRRLQFVGNIWRGPQTMRTEYLDFIALPERRREILCAFFQKVIDCPDWDEMILVDVNRRSETTSLLQDYAMPNVRMRKVSRSSGYRIDLLQGWEAYLHSLSGNARRKVKHQRRQLSSFGEICVRTAARETFEDFADQLDGLHAKRWGRPFFAGRMRLFHRELLHRCVSPGPTPRMSIIEVNGHAISALYDLRQAGREYNLQGGFDPVFAPGLSLGKLHLGYAIEAAAADGLHSFELLLGGGRRDDFKGALGAQTEQCETLQVLRAPWLKALYAVKDRLRARIAR